MDAPVVFRAPKRRKVATPLSRHDISDEEDQGNDSKTIGGETKEDGTTKSEDHQELDDIEESSNNIASLIRARKQNKFSRGSSGTVFSNAARFRHRVGDLSDDNDHRGLMQRDASSDAAAGADAVASTSGRLLDISSRFVGSSGHAVNVDKHITAYVDSELARTRYDNRNFTSRDGSREMRVPVESSSGESTPAPSTDVATRRDGLEAGSSTPAPAAATARSGLQEVDLGLSAHEVNLIKTQAALARIEAGESLAVLETKPPRRRRLRIGRDGKIMKPRPPRKRRNSEDLARDALVEKVLHENTLGIYEDASKNSKNVTADASVAKDQQPNLKHSPQRPGSSNVDESKIAKQEQEDNDEKMAERFRRDFLDAAAERQHHRHNKQTSTSKSKGAAGPAAGKSNSIDLSRGPKLGGSRSARAKMVQSLAQAKEQKK